MRVLLGSFGSHAPGIPEDSDKRMAMTPPVLITSAGLNLDFVPLLLFDQIVMDYNSYEYIINSGFKFFKSLSDSLKYLKKEGRLVTVDFKKAANDAISTINLMNASELTHPQVWLPEVREAINGWEKNLKDLKFILEEHFSPSEATAHGLRCLLLIKYGEINPKAADDFRRIIFSKKYKYTSSEIETINLVTQSYISYVHMMIVLAKKFQCPVYDWSHIGSFYRKKFIRVANLDESMILEREKITEMFSFSFPECRPRTVDDFLRLVNHKNIEELRKRIRNAVLFREKLDEKFARQALVEYLRLFEKVGKTRRIVAISTYPLKILDIFPGPWGMASELAESFIIKRVENKIMKDYSWLFFMSEIKSK